VYHTAALDNGGGGAIYISRIAGVPGDTLRIAEGKLYVNGQVAKMVDRLGEITYTRARMSQYLTDSSDTFKVPAGHYFLLSDNSANSFDGRYMGAVAAGEIRGRVRFRK
jgi:signal peptidase I